eukprot:TRINITY_DN57511_c0_g1_i1.p1 TRINITY_DN57511_c0_g1~~TRINITY_DN57511_c0_g1_i1.p1  ORF type:complete len:404 (+),score=66.57 TRINITY_DN57511_c0_g1_i1:79-1212(+)
MEPAEHPFDMDGSMFRSYGCLTPSRPGKKQSPFDDDISETGDNPITPAKKKMAHSLDDDSSTVAPSPAFTTMTSFSPSLSPCPSPFSPRKLRSFGEDSRAQSMQRFDEEFHGQRLDADFEFSTFIRTVQAPQFFTPVFPVAGAMPNLGAVSLERFASPEPPRFKSIRTALAAEAITPPVTPRRCTQRDRVPCAPRRQPAPPLMQALQSNSLEEVRKAVDEDKDAASSRFWDHNADSPLCCAARFGCDAEIFSFLLDSGADVNADDINGRTAIDIVRSSATLRGESFCEQDSVFAFRSAFSSRQNRREVERLLLASGACPSIWSSGIQHRAEHKEVPALDLLPQDMMHFQNEAPAAVSDPMDLEGLARTLESLVPALP